MSSESSEERVYIYPQSSCECYGCETKKYDFQKEEGPGIPTNLSVINCDVSDFYQCENRRRISTQKEPQKKVGIETLNPEAYLSSYSKSFKKITCKDDKCPQPQFSSWDPRTWSSTRNQYLTFDRPPISGTVKLKDVYSKELKGYGQCYGSYKDINAGQILYYIDKSREDPYYKPLFEKPVQVTKTVYKDPMGSMKPEYPRETPYHDPIAEETCNYNPYSLSWIRDSQQHREDIMASQMAKTNQERWEPRWT